MRVLYYGTYEREYPRNAQVISCLRGAGVQVLERHLPLWESTRHKFSPSARTLARAVGAEARLALAPLPDADVIVVGYPGHLDMLTAKRIGRHLPVVFNPLVSLEDTMVDDRALVKRRSPLARALHFLDRAAFRRADLVIADTGAHARYFIERFALDPDRVAVCYVGAEDRLFTPGVRTAAPFHVLFVGKLIPLHGLDTILAASRLCPEIEFRVVGSGQLDRQMAGRPSNVRWDAWIDYEQLPEAYRAAGCALGVFGTSDKASRVIPNKAFQALATATPLITAGTDAARELLTEARDALLVPPGDADALAGAIRRLAADPALRRNLAARGRATYEAHASEAALGRRWQTLLEDLIRRTTKPPTRSAAVGR